MNPAEFNRRITIQHQNGYTRDAEGNARPNWEDFLTLWAGRAPLTTRWREFFGSSAENAEMVVAYKIRYRKGIRPNMRVIDDGQVYDIVAVLDDIDGRRRVTHLMCKVVMAGG